MTVVGEELTWLRRAPLAAFVLVAFFGFALATLAWIWSASRDPSLPIFVALVGLAAAARIAMRARTQRNNSHTSIESVAENLAALDGAPSGGEAKASELTVDLVRAYVALACRFTDAERLAKADLMAARETDGERLAFLADFSHELRTPLNSILGFAHVLDSESEGPLDTDGREAVGVILASGEQLNALIEDLLDLTALETGKLELRARPVDLARIAAEVVRAAVILAAPRKLVVRLEGAASAIAMGDEKRLRRMLWNLVTRAIRASDKGAVVVSLGETGTVGGEPSRPRIIVRDEGRPMSAGERLALERGTVEEESSREGIGIGLGVVGRLVRLHGGALHIETGDGGTRLEMTLPEATSEDISWAEDNRASLVGDRPSAIKARGARK